VSQRNRYFVYDGQFLEWLPPEPLPLPRVELRPAGRYLLELDQREPNLGLRFLITDRAGGPVPVNGRDVVVVCVKDEIAAVPAYEGSIGAVFKCYGTNRPIATATKGVGLATHALSLASEATIQARRAIRRVESLRQSRRWGRPSVSDIPLGCLVDPPALPKSMADRSIDVGFLGSVGVRGRTAEAGRGGARTSAKEAARRQLVNALADLQVRSGLAVQVHTTDTYFDSQGYQEAYSCALADTKIVPCPRGNSLETYRWFEALAFGCIPVVADPLPRRAYYEGAPAVRVARWSELGPTVESLVGDPPRLEALQRAGQVWWQTQCSPGAVAERMIGTLRTVYGP
jgi:hypothetical protein